ncbi:MAG TPA: PrgI family protein [Candidatus Paceibacterota bacterium]|jgi:hypothetical protein|nr:PrgI family protein [Candidatus Paceibacterota bacterium]
MQFKVPQFIDIEDKVFGPLTFKQFAYLAGGAGFGYLAFRFLPILVALIIGPAIVAFAVALAFLKFNDKPFIHVVEAFIKFYSRSRLYLWHKQERASVPQRPSLSDSVNATLQNGRGTLTESKLKTLSWSLDVIDPKK